MAVATTSSLAVRTPNARKPAAPRRRTALKVSIGLTIATAAVVSTAALVIGLAQFLFTSLAARSDARSAITLAAQPGSPTFGETRRVGIDAQWTIIASLSLPATRMPVPEAAAVALALASPAATDESDSAQDVTGSVNVYALASTDAADRPSVLRVDAAPLAPLQLQRPTPSPARPPSRLAALPPAKSDPDEERRLARTAIYDITARTVYLPSGERLEAHSGLGRRMRGATPPNTYKLRLRESLFHGVQAIRLIPEDERAMFGRDGILAHTYMLGRSGQSNGCVVFKDYPRFLRAFLRGEVDRMIVVARLDRPPTAVARRSDPSGRRTF
jgi:hypothetical protein